MFVKCQHLFIIYWFRGFMFYAPGIRTLPTNFFSEYFYKIRSQVIRVRLGWPVKNQVRSWINLFLLHIKKFWFGSGIFWIRSKNSNPFYHIYLHVASSCLGHRLSFCLKSNLSPWLKQVSSVWLSMGSYDFGMKYELCCGLLIWWTM